MIVPINASASGDNVVLAAVAGKRIVVSDVVIYNGVATANSVKFRSATTDLHAAIPLPLAVGAPVAFDSPNRAGAYLMRTAVGEALNLNLSAATAVAGAVVCELE